jgi:hypothetical protein
LEATYNGNRGADLLAPDLFSHFPKQLFTPDQRNTYITRVKSPFAGQVSGGNGAEDNPVLAMLMYPSPAYGPSILLGTDLGKSQFHGVNFRAEKRFSHGYGFLVNYTISRLKDNVGGPNESNNSGGLGPSGVGAHDYQSVDTVRDVYGISPMDRTHRLVFMYQLDLPFGKGRHYLGTLNTSGKKFLDYVVGGWQVSGITSYNSGDPVFVNFSGININNDIRVEHTWGSLTGPLKNASFSGPSNAFRSVDDSLTGAVPIFNANNIVDAKQFTYGDFNPLVTDIRNPGQWNDDFSLMKNFGLAREGAVHLQIRAEAFNLFNRRGFGNYNTNLGDVRFGLITTAGNTERHVQLSARFFF